MNDLRQLQYFDDIVGLRLALHYNDADYLFANNDKGEIRYVFDSNIIIFFLNPLNEIDFVRFFEAPNENDLLPTAVATAEFLFSGHLAGQRLRRPMVTGAHMQHVLNKLEETQGTATRLANQEYQNIAEPSPNLHEAFREVTPDRPEQYIDALTNIYSHLGGVRGTLLGCVQELESFRRLFNDELVSPVFLDSYYSDDILNGSEDIIDELTKEVHEYKSLDHEYRQAKAISRNQRGRPATKAPKPSRAGIRADVEAIATVMAFNERTTGSAKPIQYVFVTADKVLFEAYANWHWHKRAPSADHRFVVRRISQYLPLLNVEEMPNNIQDTYLPNICSSLDGILKNLRNYDQRHYPDYLVTYTGIHKLLNKLQTDGCGQSGINPVVESFDGLLTGPIKDNPKEVASLERRWLGLLKAASALNPRLLYERHKSFDGLRNILGNKDFKAAAKELLAEQLAEVEFIHTRLSLPRNLVALISQAPAQDGKARNPRGFNFVRMTFGELTHNKPVGEYLIDLKEQGPSVREGELARIMDVVRAMRDYRFMLFASCCAFANGAWEAAHNYMERAISMILATREETLSRPVAADRNEIDAFYATTLRHWVMHDGIKQGYGKLARVEKILQRLLKEYKAANDHFGQVWALSEMAGLRLLLLYDQYAVKEVGDPNGLQRLEVVIGPQESWLRDAWTYLQEARSVLASGHMLVPESLMQSLRLKVATSEAGFYIICAAYPSLTSRDNQYDPQKILDELERKMAQSKHHPHIFWLAVPLLRAVAARDPATKKTSRANALSLLADYEQNRNDTTNADRLIMRGLRSAPGLLA